MLESERAGTSKCREERKYLLKGEGEENKGEVRRGKRRREQISMEEKRRVEEYGKGQWG